MEIRYICLVVYNSYKSSVQLHLNQIYTLYTTLYTILWLYRTILDITGNYLDINRTVLV